jgi:uncharacterized protein
MRATARHIAVDGDAVTPPLPVLTLQASAPGPTVAITANVHGDEVTGLVAAQRLHERLPDELRAGRVVIFPTLNPAGLAATSRTVPADGGDLNRCFPGRRRGRASERLADLIWREIEQASPDAVVDLHADSPASIPYALVDRPVSLPPGLQAGMRARLDRLAAATGLTVVREYPRDLYLRYALDRSLAGALVNRARIPAITIEAGPRRRADRAAVEAAVGAVRGVLAALDLLDPHEGEPSVHPTRAPGGPWRRQATPRTGIPGWLDPVCAPGTPFERGEVLARIRHVDGRIIEEVIAPRTGVVLSWVDATWLAAGSVAGTLGVVEAD